MRGENGMKMKNRMAAGVIAGAAVLFGAFGPGCTGTAYGAAAAETAETEELAAVKTGTILVDVYTNRSMYGPGETVEATVELDGGRIPDGAVLQLAARHLDTVVWQQERTLSPGSGREVFSISLPAEDFTGYSLEAYVVNQGQVADYAMSAVDVSSDWSRFPRYGYITKLDHRTDEEIAATLDRLKKHHINGLFYYDVFDSQDKPLAGSVESPDPEWKSLAGQTVDANSLKQTIAMGHDRNMRSFFYNLIFGAYDKYEERGISPEWGLYRDQRHQDQDSHDLGGSNWETPKLWMFNPANKDWQDHFVAAQRELLQVYDFDGLQMDSLGARGKRYDYWGNELELDQTYVPFLERLKELDTRILFNPVGSYGLQQQLNSGVYDAIYVEVWPGDNKDYFSLKQTLDRIYAVTGGWRGSILGAYMDYNVMKGEPFNLPGILYTNAMMAAAGGSHLELGDTGMLSSEYYPGYSLRISKELEKRVRNYYSFMVAYENLLRGPGLQEIGAKTHIDGVLTSSDAKPGTVYSFTKKKDDLTIVQILNYDGASAAAWVDARGVQTAPVAKENVTVTQTVDHEPESIWVMSPDCREGILQQVPFTYSGSEVSFTLPYLEYWDMVVIR